MLYMNEFMQAWPFLFVPVECSGLLRAWGHRTYPYRSWNYCSVLYLWCRSVVCCSVWHEIHRVLTVLTCLRFVGNSSELTQTPLSDSSTIHTVPLGSWGIWNDDEKSCSVAVAASSISSKLEGQLQLELLSWKDSCNWNFLSWKDSNTYPLKTQTNLCDSYPSRGYISSEVSLQGSTSTVIWLYVSITMHTIIRWTVLKNSQFDIIINASPQRSRAKTQS